ncbi:MAG: patatin-like phospholipase family protein [Xanthomonadales bacterium]|nr:patatin-like phospholipase family protein [Xanthomonadales bacterium]
MRHPLALYLLSTVFVLCCGCASYPVNPPLQHADDNAGYRMTNRTLGEKNTDETFVILSLSGGGTRVAALDYGVIQYLERIRFGVDNRSLLDEVDIISSSSASSIPAAYYGLFGKEVFLDDFVADVLYRKLETSLKRKILNPLEWPRTASVNFSRGDLMAEYFDKHVFNGHTFADMQRQRPFIMLNTTDMGIGSQFSFVQGYFDLICSDLSQVSVARAVTASLAFTPYFTPITLKNYNDGQCGYITPDWVQNAISAGAEADPLVRQAAKDVLSYADIDNRPYIHLLDSGISDNMGIRTPRLAFKVTDQFDQVKEGTINKLIIIMVDAKPESNFKGDLKAKPPGALTSVWTAATRPLDNYSYETVNLIKRDVRDRRHWQDTQRRTKETCDDHARSLCEQVEIGTACYEKVSNSCANTFEVTEDDPSGEFDIYLLHVSFDWIKDQAKRERFKSIPTTLELPREDVDMLIEVVPELLHEDPEFHSLLRDLEAHIDSDG